MREKSTPGKSFRYSEIGRRRSHGWTPCGERRGGRRAEGVRVCVRVCVGGKEGREEGACLGLSAELVREELRGGGVRPHLRADTADTLGGQGGRGGGEEGAGGGADGVPPSGRRGSRGCPAARPSAAPACAWRRPSPRRPSSRGPGGTPWRTRADAPRRGNHQPARGMSPVCPLLRKHERREEDIAAEACAPDGRLEGAHERRHDDELGDGHRQVPLPPPEEFAERRRLRPPEGGEVRVEPLLAVVVAEVDVARDVVEALGKGASGGWGAPCERSQRRSVWGRLLPCLGVPASLTPGTLKRTARPARAPHGGSRERSRTERL